MSMGDLMSGLEKRPASGEPGGKCEYTERKLVNHVKVELHFLYKALSATTTAFDY